jgi:hypothetical protein
LHNASLLALVNAIVLGRLMLVCQSLPNLVGITLSGLTSVDSQQRLSANTVPPVGMILDHFGRVASDDSHVYPIRFRVSWVCKNYFEDAIMVTMDWFMKAPEEVLADLVQPCAGFYLLTFPKGWTWAEYWLIHASIDKRYSRSDLAPS